jgi:hypothetical protein
MSSPPDRWAADAEDAVNMTMINLPHLGRRPVKLERKSVIPGATEDLLRMAIASGRELSHDLAVQKIEQAVDRLVKKGDIEAPMNGPWRRLRC